MSFFDFRPASPLNEVIMERAESPPSASFFSLEDTEDSMMEGNLDDEEIQLDEWPIPNTTINPPSSPPTLPILIQRKSPLLALPKQPSIESMLHARRGISKSPSIAKKCRICFQTDIIPSTRVDDDKNKSKSRLNTKFFSLFPFLRPSFWHSPRRTDKKNTNTKNNNDCPKNNRETEDDGFISPCACKGSMAWVHRVCLEEWRRKSARRDSYYACEYCFVPYRFKHTWLASLLHNVISLTLLTLIMTILALMSMMTIMGAMLSTKGDFGIMVKTIEEQGGVGMGAGRRTGTATTLTPGIDEIWSLDGSFTSTEVRSRWFFPTSNSTGVVGRRAQSTGNYRRNSNANQTAHHPSTPHKQIVHQKEGNPPTRTAQNSKIKNNGDENASQGHSRISYVNIANWLTGHSFDEIEDEYNDFFLAFTDLGIVKVWLGAVFVLAVMALIVHGTTSSLMAASLMVISVMGILLSNGLLFGWLFPLPTIYGCYRFWCWMYSVVDVSVDVFIKNFSSELENYSP